MQLRQLGKSGLSVSALGLGCMEIGGAMIDAERLRLAGGAAGQSNRFYLGHTDDATSIAALRHAANCGVTFFDTAPAYGAGHSESLIGQAFAGRRDEVVIATKFGKFIDEDQRLFGRYPDERTLIANIVNECDASLRRLRTDHIDLYQYHQLGFTLLDHVDEVLEILERLVEVGKIRWYGWSTDTLDCVRAFARGPHFTAVQVGHNLIDDAAPMLELCERLNLGTIARGAFAMGFLTGKYTSQNIRQLLDPEDFRLRDPAALERVERHLDGLRQIAEAENRTLTELALGWVWARDSNTIAIPGFRDMAQVAANLSAAERQPLSAATMAALAELLGR